MNKSPNMLKLSMMSLVPFSMVACSQTSAPVSSELNPPKVPTVYETVDLCAEDGNPLQECRKAFEAAQQNAKAGPRFVTEVDCQAEYAFCEVQKEAQQAAVTTPSTTSVASNTSTQPATPQHAGGGIFMPMMAGFMLSNALNSSGASAMAPSAGFSGNNNARKDDERRGGGSAAVYRSASGGYAYANPNNGGKAVSLGSVRSLNKANVGEYRSQKARAAQAKAASASRARASRSAGFGSSRSFGG